MSRLREIVPGLIIDLDAVAFAHYFQCEWKMDSHPKSRDTWMVRFVLKGADRCAEATVYLLEEAQAAVRAAAVVPEIAMLEPLCFMATYDFEGGRERIKAVAWNAVEQVFKGRIP